MTIAVIILTYNESIHLERALESVVPLANEVFVVDSFSTDDTVAIAEAHGARTSQRVFDNQARQFNWALDTLDIRSDWILRLDADEVLEPDLVANILRELPCLPQDVTGINLKRKHIFMGRFIRHGGRYPLALLRIWRRGMGRIEQRWMDEHMFLTQGRAITLEGGFADHNLNDLTFFTDKHNKYATREALDVLNQRYALIGGKGAGSHNQDSVNHANTSLQAAFKRRIKEQVYNRLPFWCGPLGYFLYRYFFQLGFLDGRAGLIYHLLQGFWYRFLVGAKVLELEAAIAHLDTNSARIAELERLTGHKLTPQ